MWKESIRERVGSVHPAADPRTTIPPFGSPAVLHPGRFWVARGMEGSAALRADLAIGLPFRGCSSEKKVARRIVKIVATGMFCRMGQAYAQGRRRLFLFDRKGHLLTGGCHLVGDPVGIMLMATSDLKSSNLPVGLDGM